MMRYIVSAMCVFFLFSCVSRSPTRYQIHGKMGGYSEELVEDNLFVARFLGNAYTNPKNARFYSNCRATEVCNEKELFVRVFNVVDMTTTSQPVQVTRSMAGSTPTYVTGSATGNRVYGTIYRGSQYGRSTTQTLTYRYPMFDTYFTCVDRALATGVDIESISKDDVSGYVKDLMGALHIRSVLSDSPNRQILQVGDIILRVNNIRVQNPYQYTNAIEGAPNTNRIPISLVRDGKQLMIHVTTRDVTKKVAGETERVRSNCCQVSSIRYRKMCKARSK